MNGRRAMKQRRREEKRRRILEQQLDTSSTRAFDVATLAGTVAGVAAGAIAGPPGAIVGGLVGSFAGVLADAALEDERVLRARHEDELDMAIGVSGGDLGAAARGTLPASGSFSPASLGIATGGSLEDAAGGIQSVEEK